MTVKQIVQEYLIEGKESPFHSSGGISPNREQSIICYELDTGTIVGEYMTMTEASRETGVDISQISKIIRGIMQYADKKRKLVFEKTY